MNQSDRRSRTLRVVLFTPVVRTGDDGAHVARARRDVCGQPARRLVTVLLPRRQTPTLNIANQIVMRRDLRHDLSLIQAGRFRAGQCHADL